MSQRFILVVLLVFSMVNIGEGQNRKSKKKNNLETKNKPRSRTRTRTSSHHGAGGGDGAAAARCVLRFSDSQACTAREEFEADMSDLFRRTCRGYGTGIQLDDGVFNASVIERESLAINRFAGIERWQQFQYVGAVD